MLQSVQYTSEGKLSCAGCDDVPVILCVRSEIIAQGECPVTLEDTDFVYNHISGTLVQTEEFNTCGKKYYRYTITYDDVVLVPPNLLVCTDILGILCEGCLTTYVQDVAGQEVHIEVINGVQTLVTQHGCLYPLASSGYEWTFTGDSGVAQTVSAFENVEFLGGDSISTATAPGDQLTIDLDLSTDVGQLLRFGTDGNIVLTCADVDACDEITASNGLTRTGDDIELGGTLEQNTAIDLGNHNLTFSLSAAGNFIVQAAGVDTGVLFVENTTGDVGVGTTTPDVPLHIVENSNAVGTFFSDLVTYEQVSSVPPGILDFKGVTETYRVTNPAGTQYTAATVSTGGIGPVGSEIAGMIFSIADGTGNPVQALTSTTAFIISKSNAISTVTVGSNLAGESGEITLADTNGNPINIRTAAASAAGYTLQLPPDPGITGQFLFTDGTGITNWDYVAFNVAGDAGASEIVNNGNTLTITGTGEATTTVSNPDTVTIDVVTGANFSIPLAADSGTAETVVQGDTLTIIGTGEVTTVSSNPDTITINVDPSEASSASTSDNDALALDITDAADDVTFNSIAVAITNPSATRPMDVLISVTGHAQVQAGQNGEWTHFLQRDIDGGGYVNVASLNHGPTNIGPPHETINEEWVLTYYSAHIINASTTSTFTFRQRILCNTTAAFASTVLQGLLTEGHIAVAVR